MAKKWICTVCGYVHEGDEAPDRCPQCRQPKDKFKELVENNLNFVTEHVIGVAKDSDEEMMKDLNAQFMGEATEVGMYLAMSRQADREGYPEIAEAFKRYAFEEAEHCAKFAELLGEVVWNTKTNLDKRMNAEAGACAEKCASPSEPRNRAGMPSTTPSTRWPRTRPVTARASRACSSVISRNNPGVHS